jgi:hypothetical protein
MKLNIDLSASVLPSKPTMSVLSACFGGRDCTLEKKAEVALTCPFDVSLAVALRLRAQSLSREVQYYQYYYLFEYLIFLRLLIR